MRKSVRIICFFCIAFWTAHLAAQPLTSHDNRADYVIIAPAQFLSSARTLASHRQSLDGLAAKVVLFDSVLEIFGKSTTPDSALREFIRFTLQQWQPPSSKYFVLLGNVNTIPSHREAEDLIPVAIAGYDSLSVDGWFVEPSSPQSDGVQASAVVGRFPGWDSAAIATMVTKQIAYDAVEDGEWMAESLGLADHDTAAPGLFELGLRQMQSILARDWNDTVCVHIDTASPQHLSADEFRQHWNEGISIFVYSGHANPYTLSAARYFTLPSVDSLDNGVRLPVCFFGACNLRFDEQNPPTISTHLLDCQRGGAVACVVSTGENYYSRITAFYTSLFEALAGDPPTTAGEAFRLAKNANTDPIIRRMSFLGDPAVRIKRSASVAALFPPKGLPNKDQLDQNYPNPFNPTTRIRYLIARDGMVNLAVYDMIGQKVAVLVDEKQAAGSHEANFDGRGLASGVYFCQLAVGNHRLARAMILVK